MEIAICVEFISPCSNSTSIILAVCPGSFAFHESQTFVTRLSAAGPDSSRADRIPSSRTCRLLNYRNGRLHPPLGSTRLSRSLLDRIVAEDVGSLTKKPGPASAACLDGARARSRQSRIYVHTSYVVGEEYALFCGFPEWRWIRMCPREPAFRATHTAIVELIRRAFQQPHTSAAAFAFLGRAL